MTKPENPQEKTGEYLERCYDIVTSWESFEKILRITSRDDIHKYLSDTVYEHNSLLDLLASFFGSVDSAKIYIKNEPFSSFKEILLYNYLYLTPEVKVRLLRASLKPFYEEYLTSKEEVERDKERRARNNANLCYEIEGGIIPSWLNGRKLCGAPKMFLEIWPVDEDEK